MLLEQISRAGRYAPIRVSQVPSCYTTLPRPRGRAVCACVRHPPIARETAVAAHHPMTGNRHGELVGAAGLCRCASGCRRADTLRDLGVTGCSARRDLRQRLPDPLLKCCALQVQRKIKPQARRFDKADHAGDQLLELPVGTTAMHAWCPYRTHTGLRHRQAGV